MKKIQNTLKECLYALIMILIAFFGVVASAGSMNHSLQEGWLYIVAGVANLGIIAYTVVCFYKKYLKPDSKPQTLSEYEAEQKEAVKKATKK